MGIDLQLLRNVFRERKNKLPLLELAVKVVPVCTHMTPYEPVPSVMSVSGRMCLIMGEEACGGCVCGNDHNVSPIVRRSALKGIRA